MVNKVEKFKKHIVNCEGFILSSGTLNLVHLLSKAYDLIADVSGDEQEDLKKEILSMFEIDGELDEELFVKQYHGKAKINIEKEHEANEIWNEDVCNYLSSISPEGYAFGGGSNGDGACIGWFKYEDDDEE